VKKIKNKLNSKTTRVNAWLNYSAAPGSSWLVDKNSSISAVTSVGNSHNFTVHEIQDLGLLNTAEDELIWSVSSACNISVIVTRDKKKNILKIATAASGKVCTIIMSQNSIRSIAEQRDAIQGLLESPGFREIDQLHFRYPIVRLSRSGKYLNVKYLDIKGRRPKERFISRAVWST
jgi:hypothetical protein